MEDGRWRKDDEGVRQGGMLDPPLYNRAGCGVNRMDGESNENVYRKCGMSSIEEKE